MATLNYEPVRRSDGWLKIGQKGTLRPNKEKVQVRTLDCKGLFTSDFFFSPERCGYEFGVTKSEVAIF